MSKIIRLSNGNDVSQETVDAAMEEYTLRHPEEYIFQAGDVVSVGTNPKQKRVIVLLKEKLYSMDIENGQIYYDTCGQ